MYKILDGQVNTFTQNIEDEAYKQIQNLVKYDFVQKPVAIMPDVHAGKGCTIGSVFMTKDVIIPMAVGVDIGCGMTAIWTSLRSHQLNLEKLYDYILNKTEILHKVRSKPVIYNKKELSVDLAIPKLSDLPEEYASILNEENHEYWLRQIGTLGSGNHFLEVSEDDHGDVWLIVHSGSRNFGHQVASCAFEVAKQTHLVEDNKDLSYLTGKDLEQYLVLMQQCIDYAVLSRRVMLNELLAALDKTANHSLTYMCSESINTTHNFLEKVDDHFYLNRKGACRADHGTRVIIPGSMNTNTYVCYGKGNPDSYNSCSHGAGRRMSRGQAKKAFTQDDIDQQLKGLKYCNRSSNIADELPKAYKNIAQVIEDSKELINIDRILHPLVNWKGV